VQLSQPNRQRERELNQDRPRLSDHADAAEALHRCRAGVAGLAVHAADDLHFEGYVPLVLSRKSGQEAVSDVVLLGHIAYASIQTRYPNDVLPAVVAVDLRSGKTIVRKRGDYHVRLASEKLMGCSDANRCIQLDPSTLTPISDAPNVGVPDDYVLATDETESLVRTYGAPRGVAILANADNAERPVDIEPGSVMGSASTSADDRYAFLEYLRSLGPGEDLVRVEFATGKSVVLADGAFGFLSSVETQTSPYLFDWNSGVLEVRDAISGHFICGWPGLEDAPGRVFGLTLRPEDHSLLLLRTTRSPDDIAPSLVISLDRLVARSTECGRRTAAAKAELEEAMRSLESR
jgi:hypothetical protein